MLGPPVGDVGGVCSNVVGVAGGAVGGGSVDGFHDMSELERETSPSPASCGISAMTGELLVGSIGGWRCHLRFTGGLMAPSCMQRAFGALLQQPLSYQQLLSLLQLLLGLLLLAAGSGPPAGLERQLCLSIQVARLRRSCVRVRMAFSAPCWHTLATHG